MGESYVNIWSESRMREIRPSGSTSGDVETEHGGTIKALSTERDSNRKGQQPYMIYLTHRATPRLD